MLWFWSKTTLWLGERNQEEKYHWFYFYCNILLIILNVSFSKLVWNSLLKESWSSHFLFKNIWWLLALETITIWTLVKANFYQEVKQIQSPTPNECFPKCGSYTNMNHSKEMISLSVLFQFFWAGAANEMIATELRSLLPTFKFCCTTT